MGANAATTHNTATEQVGESSLRISRFSEQDHQPAQEPRGNMRYLDQDELVDPTQSQQLATTAEGIYENYPFFGTLMQKTGKHYRRIEDIPKHDPICIQDVEEIHGAGKYKVRLETTGRQQKELRFSIEQQDPEPGAPEDPTHRIQQRSQQKTTETYDNLLNLYKQEIRTLTRQLNEKSDNVRDLKEELADVERKAENDKRTLERDYKNDIERLKDEKWDLEKQNFELQMELKHADSDGSFSLVGMLKDAAGDPETVKMLAPLLNTIFGGPVPQEGQPAALGGRANPQAENEHLEESTEPSQDHNPQPQSQQEAMSQKLRQFRTGVIQTVASSMVHGQPEAAELKQLVMNGLADLQQSGLQPEPGMWAGIAKKLVATALQHSVSPEKAADTIRPVLEQVSGAAGKLQYIPAQAAAEFLIGHYNIEVSEAQKKFLVRVLDVFKQQLKES